MQPTFSIITANFNSGDKLKDTLTSLRPEMELLEFIVIDGVSTDGSIQLAREFEAENPSRCTVISEADRGIYDAMNKGLAVARGRYVCFLGAGDALQLNALSFVRENLPDHNLAVIHGDALFGSYRHSGAFTLHRLYKQNICHQAIYYGCDVIHRIGVYDLKYRLYADWDMNFRCFANRRIAKVYLPQVLASCEMTGASTAGDPVFEKDKWSRFRATFGIRRAASVWALDAVDRARSRIRQVRHYGAINRADDFAGVD